MPPSLRCLALLLPLLSLCAAELAAQEGDRRAPIGDGVAIGPEFAKQLFEQVAPLREADGCRLERFDTHRFRFDIGFKAPSGTVHALEVATAPLFAGNARRSGSWVLAPSPGLTDECGATLIAIERLLGATEAPAGSQGGWDLGDDIYSLHITCSALLLLATTLILIREARGGIAWNAVLALLAISAVGLALRLRLSPRTFLHEYYHIAETVPGYLTGNLGPAYGKTGPAMFRLVGALLGRPEDVGVIFLTNAVFAALAVPAIALFELAVTGSWPRALLAATLLCFLPHHLRFSASEVLFIQAITFGFWALTLFVLYLRTQRLLDGLAAAVATALAMQCRPEMMLFPALPLGLLLLTRPRDWRLLFGWRSLAASALLALLLVPRLLELLSVLGAGQSPAAAFDFNRFVSHLVLLDDTVTPALYRGILAAGLLVGLWTHPGWTLWAVGVFAGFCSFCLSLFDNPTYNLRSQLLPVSFTVLIGAGIAPLWMTLWGQRRAQAARAGLALAALLGIATVVRARPFITELRDQQLEYAFLDHAVTHLPDRGRLLSAIDMGGRNLDAFPQFLLQREHKRYQLTDVRRAYAGETEWPAAGDDLLFYQGMFCYFAFTETEQVDPMTAPCAAVHERYASEPLLVEDLDAPAFSQMYHARGGKGPYRIGFYRLREQRMETPLP